MRGTGRWTRALGVAGLVVLGVAGASPAVAAGLVGHWEGRVEGEGVEIRMVVDLQASGAGYAGTMDIPAQSAKGLALGAIRLEGGKVHFELSTGGAPGIFDGALAGDHMTGDYRQGTYLGRFTFDRGAAPAAAPAAPDTLPYRQVEVTFPDSAVTLAGTLTVPRGSGPFPAVVMVTGSGPQNRDEEIFGFKPFRLIADHLTRHGIAVLRYDDRGTAGSTGDFAHATTSDFAADARAAVRFLRSRVEVDPRRIGVCGHSEGGLVAPMVAADDPRIAFVVMLSGPGLPGDSILIAQGRLILRASGASAADIAEEEAIQRRVFDAARGRGDWDSVAVVVRAQVRHKLDELPPAQRAQVGDPETVVERTVDQQLRSAKSPWLRGFIDHDPAPVLARVRCPVLALFGEKDLQVPAEDNARAVSRALERGGNHQSMVHILPRANHLYLPSETGSPSEYPSMKKEFVPEFLGLLSDWIAAHSAPR